MDEDLGGSRRAKRPLRALCPRRPWRRNARGVCAGRTRLPPHRLRPPHRRQLPHRPHDRPSPDTEAHSGGLAHDRPNRRALSEGLKALPMRGSATLPGRIGDEPQTRVRRPLKLLSHRPEPSATSKAMPKWGRGSSSGGRYQLARQTGPVRGADREGLIPNPGGCGRPSLLTPPTATLPDDLLGKADHNLDLNDRNLSGCGRRLRRSLLRRCWC